MVMVVRYFEWVNQNNLSPLVTKENVLHSFPSELTFSLREKWATAMLMLHQFQVSTIYRVHVPHSLLSIEEQREDIALLVKELKKK